MTSKIGYVPSDYLDPALRTKWNILEGMALERNDIESIEDLIMPDFDAIDYVSLILFILIRSEYDLGYVKLCASTFYRDLANDPRHSTTLFSLSATSLSIHPQLQKRKTQQFIICDKMVELEYVTN